jgi:ATP-dependent Clp protease ATP-binding subunit ClpC
VFERFTEPARQVVVLAQEEARELRHGYIGTEHLLLGVLRSAEGPATRVLGELGITADATRHGVVAIVGSGEGEAQGQIPFTPRAKTALEVALRAALGLHHEYIGTEHILLALVDDPATVAARVLLAAGAPADRVRDGVIATIREREPEGVVWASPPGPQPRSVVPLPELRRLLGLLEIAAAEAVELGDQAVGPEHVLLALAREPSPASELLALHGLTHETLREEVRHRRRTDTPEDPGNSG